MSQIYEQQINNQIPNIELNDSQYSMRAQQYNGEAWSIIHVYENDSEMNNQSQSVLNIDLEERQAYYETTKNALAVFKEVKQNCYRAVKKTGKKESSQEEFVPDEELNRDSIDQQQQSQKGNKRKMIKKNRRPFKKINSYERETRVPCLSLSCSKNKTKRRQYKNHNLKNISQLVSQCLQNQKGITFSQLFNKFISKNEQQNKNLKRRMYDVINVLKSVHVCHKKDGILLKYPPKHHQQQNQLQNQTQTKLTNLKLQTLQKKQIIQSKKRYLNDLKAKKIHIQKLLKRNQNYNQTIQQQNKLMFPLYFYHPTKNTKIQINQHCTQILIMKQLQNQENMKDELYNEMDILSCFKIRARNKVPQNIQIQSYNQVNFDYKFFNTRPRNSNENININRNTRRNRNIQNQPQYTMTDE